MPLMHKIRAYHAALAGLALLSWISGDFGIVHSWLGYGVAVILVFRILWGVFNPRQLGLSRFYPHFDGLRFDNFATHPAVSKALIAGIAVTLIGATVTGVAMDRGRAVGMADISIVSPAHADDDRGERSESGGEGRGHGLMEELHESVSNLFIVFVMMHVVYLVLFRWPLARFMLFRTAPRR